jgi:hypothetical protein
MPAIPAVTFCGISVGRASGGDKWEELGYRKRRNAYVWRTNQLRHFDDDRVRGGFCVEVAVSIGVSGSWEG